MALRKHLANDVSVRSAERKPPDFDPRRHAAWRHYRYQIWNGAPNPLLRDRAAQVERDLDSGAMRLAARSLIGEQDFASFAGLGKGVPWSGRAGRGTVRRVWAIEIAECDEMHGRTIAVDVIGDAFLPGQVRSMIGALIEVGQGRKGPEWPVDLIARRDRRAGPKSAPAHGLVLWQVGYEPFTGAHVSSSTSDVERVQG
jgi:tRNA pseudouridine38-40 synthase